MSDEQKDATVGRIMREHRENEEHIGRLQAEAIRFGQRLSAIGQGLMIAPQGVCPENFGLDVRYTSVRVGFNPSDFDVARLTALTNDYRTALQTKERLETQLTQLGYRKLSPV